MFLCPPLSKASLLGLRSSGKVGLSKNRPNYIHLPTASSKIIVLRYMNRFHKKHLCFCSGSKHTWGQLRFTLSHELTPSRQMSYPETVLPPIVPMVNMAYKASVGTDQLPLPGNVSLLIGRGKIATPRSGGLGMKGNMKKPSAGVGPALIMVGAFVAVMNVVVLSAPAIHNYCSKAFFEDHKTLIRSQTVVRNQ